MTTTISDPPGIPVEQKTRASKKVKKKKLTLSSSERAAEKIRLEHRSAVRSSFTRAGFHRVTGVSDKPFTYQNQTTDIDDVFVYENVVVISEYTCSQSSDVGGHLKNKKHIYDKILADTEAFIDFLAQKFTESADQITNGYHPQHIELIILYCSRYEFDNKYKINVPGPVYMDYPAVRYFAAVSDAVRKSSRFELLHFLGVDHTRIGENGTISVDSPSRGYEGSLLPESHSHFQTGYKIVTFYVDPAALLRTAYVLRKDGWRDTINLYQRMVSKAKIEAIRNYLKKQKRVFINNIIVTLPPDVKPVDDQNETVDTANLKKTAPVKINIPDRPNSIGIIDGQHRVFAYHETTNDDQDIAKLRRQQNLLVTGIIYPPNVTDTEREKFEARLFLEINSTQTNAKSHLKQAIGLVLDPFSTESIAARVLTLLAMSGPLSGIVEKYFFDKGKLKTSSIISYGLKPLVKASGTDSIFSIWDNANKSSVAEGRDDAALKEYIDFCAETINRMLIAVRKNISKTRWTTDPKTEGRILTTTYINSFLITLRILIKNDAPIGQEELDKRLEGINEFNFGNYHSSHYNKMAEEIAEVFFKIERQ